ncbi:V/A-type H+-transporting ATPase subunit C [Caldicoprobacter guelmensis]|uniref:V-type ATP synthase subunit C n=1 Tax=Caldicoprobacter guelmensis TaxID=1170224 RepID=UPI00195DA07B|nr:V-type ATP synthase subunit C [Caldicoprobacter guelmensis]MBM7582436.1 V/A-type H+-transporting ATPase subunit C [Caldicoprobacter guelmensis]
MPQPSYEYGVARVRVLETRVLTRERIERMVDAQSPEDALKVLSETSYAPLVAELNSPYEYEELISKEMKRVRDFIDEISPAPAITDLFFLKYDFHNIKVLMKRKYMEGQVEDLPLAEMGTVPVEVLKKGVEEPESGLLPPFVAKAVKEVDEACLLNVDPQKIDTVLDRAMYDHIFEVCRKKRNAFALRYFQMQVDLLNLRSLLRAKRLNQGFEFLKEMLIPHGSLDVSFYSHAIEQAYEQLIKEMESTPYGKIIGEGVQEFLRTGTLTAFERLMDDYLLNYVKSVKYNPFGIEAIVGYLLAKENEVRLIRIIMVGKINNLPAEKIRERLRDVYV